MADAENTFRRAADHHRQGRLDEAEALYRQILDGNPDHADANHMLGVAACQRGEFEQGVLLIGKAIDHSPPGQPENAFFHNNLGNALLILGRHDEASASFATALHIDPNLAEAHYNTGNILKDQGQPDAAVQCYERALAIKPDYAEARSNLGNAFTALGRLSDAVGCYETVLQGRPELPEVHYNLGNALRGLGRLDNAIESFQKAIEINPDYAEAHSNLGAVLSGLERSDDAVLCYQKALAADATCIAAWNNLAAAYGSQGRLDEAADCYQRAGALEDSSLRTDIMAAFLLPPILPSESVIGPLRQALSDKVNGFKPAAGDEATEFLAPHEDIGKTGFFLAYHGLNDRDLQRDIAAMYLRVSPSLAYHAPKQQQEGKEKVRIGILSMHLHSHTIGRIYLGMIENLDRKAFEVIVFRTPHQPDEQSRAIDRAADRVVPITRKLEQARQQISDENLDILFYPDIGMEPFTYFLAFSRLAPVQVVGWGHPVTTGIPNIDYFLSSEDLETPDADNHYTEHLIRLRHLPAFYHRPPQVSTVGRDHFGLPEDGRLYIIPQTLFKFHPDFDTVLGSILRQDTDGWLVVISGNRDNWDSLLMDRFRAAFPDEADRVLIIPRMASYDFVRLMSLADALLDTPHFCGGYSSSEAFAAGLAIVTWPGAFMRGRVTYAQYKAMGITDLIAEDGVGYAQLALRLAQDHEFRQVIKNRIAKNSAVLFENIAVVREIERFFISALEAANAGQALEGW
ncbi:MAG: tetratricopeptide repeat protein [Proteobacteria bacterium]|nr:tetratricopeptide repeat protein [Pseudomonadota bacterium]